MSFRRRGTEKGYYFSAAQCTPPRGLGMLELIVVVNRPYHNLLPNALFQISPYLCVTVTFALPTTAVSILAGSANFVVIPAFGYFGCT